ncbi:MAG TPA: twin-arginine translocase subunit TatB [Gammaproteobacteria bacterium]|nr:twin-arginine translocase subunit TatB [Gammaproteobacteria bacterium]
MFDIGFWEILLILILALVVIGPERLPGAARKAGYFFGKARRYIEGVRNEVEQELDVSEFKRMLHNQEVQINELQQQLKAGAEKIAADIPATSDITDTADTGSSIEADNPQDKTGASDEKTPDRPSAENKSS